MELKTSLDWHQIEKELINSISNLEPLRRKEAMRLINNLGVVIKELSKLEVIYRKQPNSQKIVETVNQINKSIEEIRNIILLGYF